MALPIHVKRIDHVTLVVRDLEESRQFYVDVLGMVEVSRPGFSFPGLWFQAGSTQIHLILEHDESGPARVFVPEECSISRTRHFAFEVEDAMAAKDRLDELGIAIVAGPKSRPDGPTQLYVFDPDRNLVELFSL
ncbi:MAG: VOC family protein [Planctomycetaceae bacterium]|nr:VOC family protein [Planctomycetaceae bacterium]